MPSLFLDEGAAKAPVEDTHPGLRLLGEASPSTSKDNPQPRRGRETSRKRPRTPKASSNTTSAEGSDTTSAEGSNTTSAEDFDDALGKPETWAPQWPSEKPQKSDFNEAEVLLNSLKTDFVALSGPDKLMAVGVLGMVLSCFFPWKTLEHGGEVLGFLSLGAWVIPLALGSFAGMVWRKRSQESFPLVPWLLQGISGVTALVFCLVLMKLFWVSKAAAELMGGHAQSSTPSVGLFLGLVFALLNLAGTGLGFKKDF